VGYRTILIGTDGSETAAIALRKAIALAKRCSAQLVIVSAHGTGPVTKKLAPAILHDARQVARDQGLETATVMRAGDPSEVLLDVAEIRGADLIVLGNLGMGRAARFRLGGVPDQVAHSAPADLLIVDTTKHPEREERADETHRTILVGTDGSPTATEAARKAFELAEIIGAAVTLVYVGDPIVGAIALEETVKGRPGAAEVQTRVVDGDPAEKIIEVARAEEIDLILVGNKGMAGPRRFLLGSVPNKVAHSAPTDVLIAKTVGRTLEDIKPGHGAVVRADGQRVAAYRDEAGGVIALSPRCTHMGCTVDWNDAEKTWDCPCHGSRYSSDGTVIRGPATNPLAKQDLPQT
jgi:nucleotide-binding universal stress UspA family protein/nitrite reductase/ring-hydroxylating ferredoxin subunit